MRSNSILRAFAIITAVFAITLGTGSAFAQGKGRGGDRGGGQGKQQKQQAERPQKQQQQRAERQQNQRQQQRAERPQNQRPQQPQRAERPQNQRQQQQQRAERPQNQRQEQQQAERPNMDRQNQAGKNNGRGQVEQQRSQPNMIPGDMRMMDRQSAGKSGKDKGSRNQPRYRPMGIGDNGGNDRNQQSNYPMNNAWPNNYGYERSSEVHARNAERKAFKDENRNRRSDNGDRDWFAYRYSAAPNYAYSPYAYRNHQRWTDVLRNVVANVFGNNAGYDDRGTGSYWSVSYGTPYYTPYYGGNYYNDYPQYRSYAFDPYAAYDNGYGYAPAYYGQPNYAVDQVNVNLPLGITVSFGNGYDRQMSNQLLATGYYQGYTDGQYASNAGYGDQYYDDPYVYQEAMYDPYSYSIGENRHCLSDGYELGYVDAQNRGISRDPNEFGSPNLVSVLISSSLTVY